MFNVLGGGNTKDSEQNCNKHSPYLPELFRMW